MDRKEHKSNRWRRLTRENASPSFQPLTTVEHNLLGSPKPLQQQRNDVRCDLVMLSSMHNLHFKISGLSIKERVNVLISNVSPNLSVSAPNESPSDDPLVIFELRSEFSIEVKGSGTFSLNLFTAAMEIVYQKDFVIVDSDAPQTMYSSAIQKTKHLKFYPELVSYTNHPKSEIQAIHLNERACTGFGENGKIFSTYWDSIHDVLRTKKFLDVQLFSGSTYRFVSCHVNFIARCLKFYRSKYKHTSKAPEPAVNAFKLLHEIGF